MFSGFIEALPDKVRSSNDLEYGCKFRKKEKALQHLYVELPQLYKKFIALDIDIPGSFDLWYHLGLPPPTYVMVNPENAKCHYLYELKTPVYYTEHSRRGPQTLYARKFVYTIKPAHQAPRAEVSVKPIMFISETLLA